MDRHGSSDKENNFVQGLENKGPNICKNYNFRKTCIFDQNKPASKQIELPS